MLSEKIEALVAAKARVQELERVIAAELSGELARLPVQFGFSDTASFITALRRAASGQKGGGRTGAGEIKKRKRAKITDTIRSRVRKLVEEGKTGAEIAGRLRISIPTVQKIKKALGLVRNRPK